ncbi:citrate synthase 2 [Mobilicoccus sp.]|uniref:citrate synthase 2 n=1 Tax=Mobilicoccus sp. TaxID=2034349 RepID=UPI00289FE617|nr:citrate synthase 2 [Mobilicoccus sp.]
MTTPGEPPPFTGTMPRTTAIAEADPDGGVLRYRGVDVRELVGVVPFDRVWGLLVVDDLRHRLPPADIFPLPARTGDMSADVVSALASVSPVWGFGPLHDIDDATAVDHLARASVLMLSFVAQSARGPDLPVVPQRVVDTAGSVAERFLVRWRGEADPRHVEALDAYFVTAAEHGFNASTATTRLVASTGADVATCLAAGMSAISGPLHGGAPARVLRLLEAVADLDDPTPYLTARLDSGRRIMGFGHSVYRARDPRADVIREVCRRLDAPLFEVADAVDRTATALLTERHPGHDLHTNLDFWAAVLLSFAEVPPNAFSSLFGCARSAGWSAHILEQKRLGIVIRPYAQYVGRPPRPVTDVAGWEDRPPPPTSEGPP